MANPNSASSPPPDPNRIDVTEQLLGRCLELSEGEWSAAIERVCAEHPDHAESLRRRFDALRAVGLAPYVGGEEETTEFDPSRVAAPSDADRDAIEALYRDQPQVAAAFAEVLGLPRQDLAVKPVHAPLRGRVLNGRYVIGDLLGSGSMGAVYSAFDRELARDVAVKFLDARLFGDPHAEARFLREAELLATLRHDHVVTVFDRGRGAQGELFLVMERLAGASLRDLLDGDAGSPAGAEAALARAREHLGADAVRESSWLRQAVRWTADLANGLGAAHDKGVFHRDVKPSNVFVDRRGGRAVLLDFGIAVRAGDAQLTASRSVLGTPCYMAPEQAAADAVGAPTAELDVYALTSTLYHLLTGRPPFVGDPLEVLARVQRDDPVPARRLVPELPRDLVAILDKGMERDPRRRYASMQRFRADLEAFLAHQPVSVRPLSALQRGLRRARRAPAASAAVVATVATVVLTAVLVPLWTARAAEARSRDKFALEATLPAQLAFEGTPDQRLLADLVVERERNVELLDRILELDPDDLAMRLFRAALLLDNGEHERAAADLAHAARAEAGSPYLAAVATRYAAASRQERGVAAVDLDDLGVEPATTAEHFVAGFHELRRRHVAGFHTRAEEHLRTAMGDYVPARDVRLLALLACGELDRDAARFQEAYDESLRLEEVYGRPTARTCAVRGAALVAMKRYADAIEPLERSVELRPGRHSPLQNLGVAYRRLADLERAEECLARAEAVRPHLVNTRYTRAQVLVDLRRFEAARELAATVPATGWPHAAWRQPYLVATICLHELGDAFGRPELTPERVDALGAAARPAFATALEHAPKSIAARIRASQGLFEALSTTDRDRAAGLLATLLWNDPLEPAQLGNLASLIPRDGLSPESAADIAVLLTRIALSQSPDDSRIQQYFKDAFRARRAVLSTVRDGEDGAGKK